MDAILWVNGCNLLGFKNRHKILGEYDDVKTETRGVSGLVNKLSQRLDG